jgi:hypothetical protein
LNGNRGKLMDFYGFGGKFGVEFGGGVVTECDFMLVKPLGWVL